MHKYQKNKYDIPPVGQLTKENIEMCILHPMRLERILVPTRGGISSQTIRFACEIAKAYNSILSVLHVVHIPFFMPLNTSVLQREAFSEDVLTRAKD
ncbi:MAG: universal stress protein, partial [Chlamydiae bacterium]|nr:universal stress protein [Chlamydiota bacterium]